MINLFPANDPPFPPLPPVDVLESLITFSKGRGVISSLRIAEIYGIPHETLYEGISQLQVIFMAKRFKAGFSWYTFSPEHQSAWEITREGLKDLIVHGFDEGQRPNIAPVLAAFDRKDPPRIPVRKAIYA